MNDHTPLTSPPPENRTHTPPVDTDDRFWRVVEHAPNAMILVNEAGRIEMVNAETEQVFGYARDELLGQSIEMLVPERFRHNHAALRASFAHAPGPRPMGPGRDLYALRKDGSEFPVEIGLNPIPIGDRLQILAAIVDISDRKSRQEKLEKSLSEKELLLAEVLHRVKNNLQIVYSLLDMQLSQIADPVARDMLRDSCSRVRSMAQIHQTLYQSGDVSQVDLGYFLDVLVASLSGSYAVDADKITIASQVDNVHLAIEQAVPCGLIANELISNCLKHAFPDGHTGKITIDASLTGDHGGRSVCLSVSDNGIGLPDDLDIENGGSLGLHLVHMLVDQLGGTIDVHRHAPARITIEFPQGSPNA